MASHIFLSPRAYNLGIFVELPWYDHVPTSGIMCGPYTFVDYSIRCNLTKRSTCSTNLEVLGS